MTVNNNESQPMLPAEFLPPGVGTRADRRRLTRAETKAAKRRAPGTAQVSGEDITLTLMGATRDRFRQHVHDAMAMRPPVSRMDIALAVFQVGLDTLDAMMARQAPPDGLVKLAGSFPSAATLASMRTGGAR